MVKRGTRARWWRLGMNGDDGHGGGENGGYSSNRSCLSGDTGMEGRNWRRAEEGGGNGMEAEGSGWVVRVHRVRFSEQ